MMVSKFKSTKVCERKKGTCSADPLRQSDHTNIEPHRPFSLNINNNNKLYQKKKKKQLAPTIMRDSNGNTFHKNQQQK